jgi:hypothetical protein
MALNKLSGQLKLFFNTQDNLWAKYSNSETFFAPLCNQPHIC